MTKFFKYGAAASALALLAAGAVHAQETTGGIKGTVTNEQGAPVAGAKVTIVHVPTGVTQTVTTDSTGYYMATQLSVGGPYHLTVKAGGITTETDVAYVGIGEPTQSDVVLKAGTASTTEVVVKGRRSVAVAGRTKVGAEEIEQTPTLTNDIRDYALKSPSAYMDPTNSNALSLGGLNNRTNAILVDGVRLGDDFGLNANGLPTQRTPLSTDSIESVNVDTAPYDVQYSFFQGGIVNYVTKSGGNEFHGGFKYEKTDNSMRGKKFVVQDDVTGADVTKNVTGNFSEKTYNAYLSGPIIKDRLFFFGLYEKFEGTQPALNGPSDSTAPSQVPGVTQAQVDQIRNDLKTLYNYDPLDWKADSIPYTNEIKQLKLTWVINDNHRANFFYVDTKGQTVNETGSSASGHALALLSKWYTLESDLKVYKGQLLSRWSENLTTEVNIARKEVVNISNPLGGDKFAQFTIRLPTPVGLTGSQPTVLLGPDISRQANVLTNNVDHYDFKAKYRWNTHNFTFGAEYEKVDVFNLFVQNATGQYLFNSIADLEAKKALSVTYANAASNNKTDGAASFSYATNTLYAQDEWRVTPRLTVTAGLRYDGYTSKDLPAANSSFQTNYGYTNAKGLDGLSLIQPRLAFNWRPAIDSTLIVYGSWGLFQGGNPNVWISNSYTNTGNLLGSVTCSRTTVTATTNCNNGTGNVATPGALDNIDGFNVSSTLKSLNTASANAGTGNTNAIDPNFKLPAIGKATLGIQKTFDLGSLGDNYKLNVEYTSAKYRASVYWQDLYMEKAQTGTAPDGRPTFYATTVNGVARANRTDVVFKSIPMGDSKELNFALSKAWNEGLAKGLTMDLSASFTKANDLNSGTSSVATSSYRQTIVSNPNHPQLATSNYQIDTIAKAFIGYSHKFWGDNRTSIRLNTTFRTGQRYSFTFDEPSATSASNGMYGMNGLYTGTDNQLFYVPKADSSGNVTATSDPLVHYFVNNADHTKDFNVAAFNDLLQKTGLIKYAGTIAPRNGFKSPNFLFSNVRIMQELPSFPNGTKLELYLDIQNVGNMINDEWGTLGQYSFPYNRNIVQAMNCQAAAQPTETPNPTGGACQATGNFYQYNSFTPGAKSYTFGSSVYQYKVGIKYKF